MNLTKEIYDLIGDTKVYTIQRNITIDDDLLSMAGVILKPISGITLTLNGAVNAGSWQIFDLSLGGTIIGPFGGSKVNVKWFGAKGDGVTDDSIPIQAAIDSGGVDIEFPPGDYYATNLTFGAHRGIKLRGPTRNVLSGNQGFGATIRNNGATPLFTTSSNSDYIVIEDLTFRQSQNTNGHIFSPAHDTYWLEFHRCYAVLNNPDKSFYNQTAAGIRFGIQRFRDLKIIAQPTGGMNVPVFDVDSSKNTFGWRFEDIQIDLDDNASAVAIRIKDSSGSANTMIGINNMLLETPKAGGLELRGQVSGVFQSINIADTANPTGPLIFIGNYSGPTDTSRDLTFIGCNVQGGDATYPDLECETTNNITIIESRFGFIKSEIVQPHIIGGQFYPALVGDTVPFHLNFNGEMTGCQGISATATRPVFYENTETIDLTNAEIKALATTPITLVAAPGVTKLIELVSAIFTLNYGSEVLAEPSAPDDLAIRYNNGSGIIVATFDSTYFVESNQDAIATVYPSFFGDSAAKVIETSMVNYPLVLHNAGSDYTGNSSNDTTMRVIVTYRVHKSLGL